MEERWRPVLGFNGKYEISDQGRIRSKWFDPPRLMNPKPDHKGYPRVTLSCGRGRHKYRYVHDLVLRAFVGAPPPGHVVAHLDGDQTNVALSNLLWATPEENNRHRTIHGTQPRGRNHPNGKLSDQDVADIRAARIRRCELPALAKRYGISYDYCKQIRAGRERRESADQARARLSRLYPHARNGRRPMAVH